MFCFYALTNGLDLRLSSREIRYLVGVRLFLRMEQMVTNHSICTLHSLDADRRFCGSIGFSGNLLVMILKDGSGFCESDDSMKLALRRETANAIAKMLNEMGEERHSLISLHHENGISSSDRGLQN